MLSYQPPGQALAESYKWLLLQTLVFIPWGVQASVLMFATGIMVAESLFF